MLLIGLCLLGFAGAHAAAHAADEPRVPDDLAASLWEPNAADAPGYCTGRYRTFDFPHPRDAEDADFPVHASGERAAYQVDGEIELDGEVSIVQGNRTLRSARARLDHGSGDGVMSGGIRVEEPGLVMIGERAEVNINTRAARSEDVQFVLLDSELRGRAETVSRDQAGTLVMSGGAFTRCEPGNNNWRLSASSVTVEEGEIFGLARNAVMRVRDVPVFYAPYVRFPVTDDRQSGWLFPNMGYSDEDGTDISLPYYLNLAPDYDATIMPRYVSERGSGLETEFRHLSRWEETTLTGAFLHQDELFDGTFQRKDFDELAAAGEVSGEFDPADRWLYAVDHDGAVGPFSTRIDYTAVSDRDYFRDLGSDLGVSSRIELERLGEVQYASGGLLVRLWAQRFQRLDEGRVDPYQRLPALGLTYAGNLPGPFEWSLGAEHSSFDRDNDALSGITAAVGDRLHVEPRLRLPFSAPWGFLTFTGGFRHTRYDLRDVPEAVDPEPERNIGLGSVHGGLFFERELSWFGVDLVQTLEPQLYYLYQEFAPQDELPRFDATALTFSYSQLFRDNRFAGVDRIGDANQLSVGVTSRFVNAASGREYFRASLGEIVYFEDRRVTLGGTVGDDERQSTSALAAELAANVAGAWSLSGTVVWDHHDDKVEEAAAGLQYRRDNRHIVNLGYRKRIQGDIDQTDVSFNWPVSKHYSVVGRWNYDVVSGRTVEGFGGIEYNDCCWRIRVMARRFLDSPTGRNLDTAEADEGIFLQVVFKGLAGFGNKLESVLERGIRGYRAETANGN
ncbi:MAG: LPS assembly protein LptD [Gammaproteobacteria bacterium]|nr:LPS assembly protein LptD [Gammaproteobacteria bacterium]